jgi:hypothetical protein
MLSRIRTNLTPIFFGFVKPRRKVDNERGGRPRRSPRPNERFVCERGRRRQNTASSVYLAEPM